MIREFVIVLFPTVAGQLMNQSSKSSYSAKSRTLSSSKSSYSTKSSYSAKSRYSARPGRPQNRVIPQNPGIPLDLVFLKNQVAPQNPGITLRRISCHGRNHSHTRCKYSYTIFLCYHHYNEYSLLGSKFFN